MTGHPYDLPAGIDHNRHAIPFVPGHFVVDEHVLYLATPRRAQRPEPVARLTITNPQGADERGLLDRRGEPAPAARAARDPRNLSRSPVTASIDTPASGNSTNPGTDSARIEPRRAAPRRDLSRA